MIITEDNIQDYIFNPDKPEQCKSYKLLLNIAKKEPVSWFSPEFLQFFFKEEVINDKFKNELYDIPDNYDALSVNEKFNLFKEQVSDKELEEYIDNVDISNNKLFKFNFLNKIYFYNNKNTYYNYSESNFKKYTWKDIIDTDSLKKFINVDASKNIIIFSKSNLNVLSNNIQKSSIFITLTENIDNFLSMSHKNIKPIFLNKIEDANLLLSTIKFNLNKNKNKSQNEISNFDSIKINNCLNIKNVSLENLKDKKEIYIVGENGDGKTLLLQAITAQLKGTTEDGLKTFRENDFDIEIKNENKCRDNLFAYGSSRNNYCQIKTDTEGYLTLFDNSYDLIHPIEWLLNLDYTEKSTKDNVISTIDAKKLLKRFLQNDIKIDISSKGVIFSEKGTKNLDFNKLSAGYKSVITMICDLIDRFSSLQKVKKISDFKGIVLIDEIELHLHPKWKYSFMRQLRDTFPLVQFIATTHSPTVILGASKEAIFYKIYKNKNGEIQLSEQVNNKNGFTSNTVISSPLFNLETMKSEHYDLEKFSSDDYIYEKIHEVVSQRLNNINEVDIIKLIEKELDNYDKN